MPFVSLLALSLLSLVRLLYVHDVRTSSDVTTRKNVRSFSSARRKRKECNNLNRTEQERKKNDAVCQVRSTKEKCLAYSNNDERSLSLDVKVLVEKNGLYFILTRR